MMNLHSSIMLYTNYDYDKSKIKMETGDDPSSPKNYHELSARYLFVGGLDTPNLHRIQTVLYPFGVTSIP